MMKVNSCLSDVFTAPAVVVSLTVHLKVMPYKIIVKQGSNILISQFSIEKQT